LLFSLIVILGEKEFDKKKNLLSFQNIVSNACKKTY